MGSIEARIVEIELVWNRRRERICVRGINAERMRIR